MIVQQQMLCGDEVKAVVADLGSSVCRFGTAGQDLPRHVFRSELGIISGSTHNQPRIIYGDTGIRLLREDLYIRGLSEASESKWDDMEKILQRGIHNCMGLDAKECPILIAQNHLMRDSNSKEKMMEICFEQLQNPALYMMPSSVLSSVSAGRSSGLVIDVGAESTRITPVIDGYECRKAAISTSRAGNMVDSLLQSEIESTPRNLSRSGNTGSVADRTVQIKPWFDCKATSTNTSQVLNVTESFRRMHLLDIVQDCKKSMCFIPFTRIELPSNLSHGPTVSTNNVAAHLEAISAFREAEMKNRSIQFPLPYELPDGTLVYANESLCTVPERVFFPSLPPSTPSPTSMTAPSGVGLRASGIANTSGIAPVAPTTTNKKRGTTALKQDDKQKVDVVGVDNMTTARKRIHSILESEAVQSDGNADSSSGIRSANTSSSSFKLNVDEESLSDLVYTVIAKCDVDVRKDLLANIHVVGGGSLITGMIPRLTSELNYLVPSQFKVKFVSALPAEKLNSAWIGGSILGICGSFQQMYVSRAEYEEYGPDMMKNRFDH